MDIDGRLARCGDTVPQMVSDHFALDVQVRITIGPISGAHINAYPDYVLNPQELVAIICKLISEQLLRTGSNGAGSKGGGGISNETLRPFVHEFTIR